MIKYMKICLIALLGGIFMSSMTCHFTHLEVIRDQKVILRNLSEENIWFIGEVNYTHRQESEMDLSVLLKYGNPTFVKAKSDVFLRPISYDSDGVCNVDNYQILIIKQSTMQKYTLGYIVENNIYDNLLIYSYEDLKAMNYQITYKGLD